MTTLENRGLISRERNPDDRREYLLRLTPEGRQQLAAAVRSSTRPINDSPDRSATRSWAS